MSFSVLAAMAIGAALSAGAKAIPSAAEKRNAEELKKLKRLEGQGRLGLTDKERGVLEEGLLSPVRAQAREQRLRTGQVLGAQGLVQPAELQRSAQLQGETTAKAAMDAARIVEEENMRRARAQKQELEERTGEKAKYQAGILQGAMEGAAQGLQFAGAGKYSALMPQLKGTTPLDTSKLEAAGFSAEDTQNLRDLATRDPELVADIMALYESGVDPALLKTLVNRE